MIKIEIKSIFGEVLFTIERENNTIKDTLVEAVKNGADLGGANLRGANLRGADLRGADLYDADLYGADLRAANLYGADLGGADLRGADLGGANLGGADLGGADLYGADLRAANLRGADLGGANLGGADLRAANLYGADLGGWGKISSNSDILILGPIGSRNDYTAIYHTDKGIFIRCGCFSGTIDEFFKKVKETHKGNKHEQNYLAMVDFVKKKFEV